MTDARHGVLLTIAYDGTDFSGWASQSDARTVSDVVAEAVKELDPLALGPFGTSRTDAGVHARAHLATIDSGKLIDGRGWVLGVNRHLPDDVAVRAARAVPPDFRPRFASTGKRYRYRILRDRVRNPLDARTAWRVGYDLDVALMQREAQAAVGTFDFAAFRAARDDRERTVRTITRLDLVERDGGQDGRRELEIVVEGSAFLYNMVRILVGTLVDVGRGKLAPGAIERALASLKRSDGGETAPALGLTLDEIFLELPRDAGPPWPAP